MIVTDAWLERIKAFEGFRANAYLDPVGIPTIGYGFTQGVKLGDAITEVQADARLVLELMRFARAVAQLCPVALNDAQRDALIDFAYNAGPARLRSSTLRQKVLRGDHEAAIAEFARWVYAGGRRLRGLVLRRAAEAQRYGER